MLSRQAVRNAHKAAARSSAASKTEEVTKLSSGLTVASIDKQGAHSQLVLAFRAGSRYEDKTQGGLVHHMRNHVGRDAKNYFGTSLVWSASEAGGALTRQDESALLGDIKTAKEKLKQKIAQLNPSPPARQAAAAAQFLKIRNKRDEKKQAERL